MMVNASTATASTSIPTTGKTPTSVTSVPVWSAPPLSNNTPLIYVDPVAGVDGVSRVYLPAQTGGVPSRPTCAILPVRTLNFARDLMLSVNGGTNGRPGRILPKRGETFREIAKLLNGASTTDKFVLEAWGDPALPRPVIDYDGGVQINGGLAHAAVLHVSFRCSAYNGSNVSAYGMVVRGRIDDVLVEGCDAWRMGTAFSFEGDGSTGQVLTFNRNAVSESWRSDSATGNPQGFYVAGGVALHEDRCYFFHNGWRVGDLRTAYTNYYARMHARYIQGDAAPATVTNEVVVDTFSDGIQQRSGGTITGGYYGRNPMAIIAGAGCLVDSATIEDSCNIRDDNSMYSRAHAVQWTGGSGGRGRKIVAFRRSTPVSVNRMALGFVEGSNNGVLENCVVGSDWPKVDEGGTPFFGMGSGDVAYDLTKNNAPVLVNNNFNATPSAPRHLEDYLASIGITPGADPYATYGALIAQQRYGHYDARLESGAVAAYERAVWAIPSGS